MVLICILLIIFFLGSLMFRHNLKKADFTFADSLLLTSIIISVILIYNVEHMRESITIYSIVTSNLGFNTFAIDCIVMFLCSIVLPFFDDLLFDIQQKIDLIPMKDKLFLLSTEEVEKYLPTEESRKCKCNGQICWWWLRTLGYMDCCVYAAYVSSSGYMNQGGNDITFNAAAIRPALYLNPAYLQSLERISYESMKSGSTEWIPLDEDKSLLVSLANSHYECVRFGNREWIVLNEDSGLLLSKDAVCKHNFDKKTNIYKKSAIRKYLNDVLLKELFTDEEQKKILTTTITADDCEPLGLLDSERTIKSTSHKNTENKVSITGEVHKKLSGNGANEIIPTTYDSN